MIHITKPFLPPKSEYDKLTERIWETNWLTNNGPLVKEFETGISQLFNIPNLMYVTNGTISLQLAIKALDLKDEIITTPFSYVATTSSIVWENCKPVFADIDPETFNVDPTNIEKAITDKTTSIMVTHVFGNPCDVEAIQKIADKHNLKIIYDAAHCFGVEINGKSIFSFGDISSLSLHATKVFHSTEGGFLFSHSPELIEKMQFMRNFGHDGPGKFASVGINGKISEFHAAMGLCNLKYREEILATRKRQYLYYKSELGGLGLQFQKIISPEGYNYSYFPLLFQSEDQVLKVSAKLKEQKINPRRYFYPSLDTLPYINESYDLKNSAKIAQNILCLPLYHSLTIEEQDNICKILKSAL